ncbi:TIM barrel protein [Candidatus Poribacteria bacterium]|nr:TIM barrel protein [Candidatus Poribacteria bacterium]
MSWKLALHTVSYAGVWRGQSSLPVEDILDKAKAAGYEGIMLMSKRPHISTLDMGTEKYQSFKNKLKSLNLQVACIAGYTDFTAGIERPMSPMAEMHAVYINELARLAVDLGTPIIRIFTGLERGGVVFDKHWEACVKGLKLASQQAAEHGAILVVQNHHDVGVHHDSMRWLLEEVDEPNCKAAFDAWAPALQDMEGEEIKQAVYAMKPFILHTTVADYARLPRYTYDPTINTYNKKINDIRAVPMGEGFVDYPGFFAALEDINYQGWVAYEMCAPLKGGGSIENLDKCAKIFVDYMKSEKWRNKS